MGLSFKVWFCKLTYPVSWYGVTGKATAAATGRLLPFPFLRTKRNIKKREGTPMKKLLLLLGISMIASWGCQKSETESGEEITGGILEIQKRFERLKRAGTGGLYSNAPGGLPTQVELLNLELSLANNKSMENLTKAIERLNDSSTTLSGWILALTIVMTVLVALQVAAVWDKLWKVVKGVLRRFQGLFK